MRLWVRGAIREVWRCGVCSRIWETPEEAKKCKHRGPNVNLEGVGK